MDISLIICTILFALIVLIGGYSLRNMATKKINHVIGYRTILSMKNQDTWAFANDELGKLWIKIGWFLVPFTIVFNLIFYMLDGKFFEAFSVVYIMLMLVIIFITIFIVEGKMKKTFNRDGSRKEELD